MPAHGTPTGNNSSGKLSWSKNNATTLGSKNRDTNTHTIGELRLESVRFEAQLMSDRAAEKDGT